jgi:hypothetical protein
MYIHSTPLHVPTHFVTIKSPIELQIARSFIAILKVIDNYVYNLNVKISYN